MKGLYGKNSFGFNIKLRLLCAQLSVMYEEKFYFLLYLVFKWCGKRTKGETEPNVLTE